MITSDSIHFHWRLVQNGEQLDNGNLKHQSGASAATPNLEFQGGFCRIAERMGIESVLVDINYAKPDPTLLTTALVHEAKEMSFIIAVRSGLLSPTLFTQQINTLSTFSNGRIYLNVVAGHSPAEQKYYGDFLNHDERYERTDDFLKICTSFWKNTEDPVNIEGKYIKVEGGVLKTPYVSSTSDRPFIFVAGGSQPAIDLTLKYGDCWMQLASTPEIIREKVAPVLSRGKAVGLRLSVICRETNSEAVNYAEELFKMTKDNQASQKEFVSKSDSQSIQGNNELAKDDWPSPNLWMGAAKTVGPTGIALVGSYNEVAEKIMEYYEIGVTHFIFSGWPKQDEMIRFGENVIPIVRQLELKLQFASEND